MREGQGFRHGSEDTADEDSLDRTQSNGLDNTQSIGRARRTPRGPIAYPGRSGSRVSILPLPHDPGQPSCGPADMEVPPPWY